MKDDNPASEKQKPEDVYLAIALVRGLRTLQLLAEARTPLPLVEISRQLNLTRGVAFRLVHTLEAEGYIERVDQVPNYRPAAKVLSLGLSYLQSLGLPELARTQLEQLRTATSSSIHLAVLDKQDVVYVSRLPAKEGRVDYLEIGDRSPAHASAIGMAMLSQLARSELEELYGSPPGAVDNSTTDVSLPALLAQLADIKEKGYASSMGGLYPNVFAIACPILNAAGELAGGVSITTLDPGLQETEAELSRHVLTAARQISEKLGFTDKAAASNT